MAGSRLARPPARGPRLTVLGLKFPHPAPAPGCCPRSVCALRCGSGVRCPGWVCSGAAWTGRLASAPSRRTGVPAADAAGTLGWAGAATAATETAWLPLSAHARAQALTSAPAAPPAATVCSAPPPGPRPPPTSRPQVAWSGPGRAGACACSGTWRGRCPSVTRIRPAYESGQGLQWPQPVGCADLFGESL